MPRPRLWITRRYVSVERIASVRHTFSFYDLNRSPPEVKRRPDLNASVVSTERNDSYRETGTGIFDIRKRTLPMTYVGNTAENVVRF